MDLPLLVFYGQRGSVVPGRSTTDGPQDTRHTFMKSVSDCLVRDVHTGGLLEFIFLGSSCFCTVEPAAVSHNLWAILGERLLAAPP